MVANKPSQKLRVILERVDIEQCALVNLGLAPYEEAWELQRCLAEVIARDEHLPVLLLCEHPHTYTFGRRGQWQNLLWEQAELERRGVSLHWVDRGGDVTYHGPGQLVGYPLLPLGRPVIALLENTSEGRDGRIPQADYLGYLRQLEEMLILALLKLGVVSGQIPGLTGVWVQPDSRSRCSTCPPSQRGIPAKIAAIGVKVDARGISRHGFSLNVDPDMSYWDGIVPCGLEGYPSTSLAELLKPAPTMQEVLREVCSAFEQTFGCRLVEMGTERARVMCK